MKILVTGHNGFIGQNMVKALKEHEVYTCEWGDPFPVVKNMDWVIHLGAISSTTETNVLKIFDHNVRFSIELLEECIIHNTNFQWASSASVYGNTQHFREDLPCAPLNHYARSKYILEEYIRVRNAPIITQGFRYFNVYGPHEDHKGEQASPHTQFEKQARKSGVINVFEGSDFFKRDFVPVSHVVDIHKKFFKVGESGIWNVGTGLAKSFVDVASEVAARYNAAIKTIPFPEHLKKHYQEFTCADLTKLRKTLNDYT